MSVIYYIVSLFSVINRLIVNSGILFLSCSKCVTLAPASISHFTSSGGKQFCMMYIQLFRERLSYKHGNAYATISKVIMGNGGFYSCLSKPQDVSAWWKETAQTHLFFFLVPC